jgi:ABC-type branched-subunit amino acid transport system substrate-binding protein/LysM repeat protein
MILLLAAFPGVTQNTAEQMKQIRSNVKDTIDGRVFYIHTIKRGQTLYMISKAYGVEVNDLIEENPGVKNGIKADEKLRIPLPGQKKEAPPKRTPLPPVKDPGASGQESKKEKPADTVLQAVLPCGMDTASMKPSYNVALMLPLYLSEAGSINPDVLSPDPLETYKSLQFIQFYEGFRMAVDSLQKTGLSITLHVYDVDKDTVKTKQVIKKPEMKKMDLIIGLLYHRNFQMVAAFAEKNKIPIVNPISERRDIITGNPYVFKTRPSKKSQMDELADFFAGRDSLGQILIIRNGQFRDKEMTEQLKSECTERNLAVTVPDGQENAIPKLSREKENVIVAFSESIPYVLDLCRRFFALRNDYRITLVGLPQWEKLESIEPEYLVELHAHYMAPFFVDYDDPNVKKFVRTFQSQIKTDPDILAFQGFDVGFYFLSALQRYGSSFQKCLNELKVNSLQTTFEFIQSSKANGYENRHWEIYKFGNYRLVKVN